LSTTNSILLCNLSCGVAAYGLGRPPVCGLVSRRPRGLQKPHTAPSPAPRPSPSILPSRHAPRARLTVSVALAWSLVSRLLLLRRRPRLRPQLRPRLLLDCYLDPYHPPKHTLTTFSAAVVTTCHGALSPSTSSTSSHPPCSASTASGLETAPSPPSLADQLCRGRL
jgi:hypothetical protein